MPCQFCCRLAPLAFQMHSVAQDQHLCLLAHLHSQQRASFTVGLHVQIKYLIYLIPYLAEIPQQITNQQTKHHK